MADDFTAGNEMRGASGKGTGPPRLTTSTYRAYWFSHNLTTVDPAQFPNAARARPSVQVFNRDDLGGVGPSGGGALIIEALRVIAIQLP